MRAASRQGEEPGGHAERLIGEREFARFQSLIHREMMRGMREAGIWLSPMKRALLVGRLARRLAPSGGEAP